MKYVPSLPPPIGGVVDRYELRPLPAVQGTRPVQTRNLPPLIFQHRRYQPEWNAAEHPERRHDPHLQGERRHYCRRISHQPVLLELRSGKDRRHHRQRSGDLIDHIDEEA